MLFQSTTSAKQLLLLVKCRLVCVDGELRSIN